MIDDLYWHFLAADRRLRYRGRRVVEAGKTYSCRGVLLLCGNGMHASKCALDALNYAPGPVVSRVRLSGEIVHGDDKCCARSRTVLWLADASATLHEFGCWCAEQALLAERERGREPQAASWAAIAAKRKWLRGEITVEELDAARSAARSAAESAARSAAWSAARDKQNDVLERLLLALAPAEGAADGQA